MRFPLQTPVAMASGLAAIALTLWLVGLIPGEGRKGGDSAAKPSSLRPPSKPSRRPSSSGGESGSASVEGPEYAVGASRRGDEGGGFLADRLVTLPDGRTVSASMLASLGIEDPAFSLAADGSGRLRRQLLERAGRLATNSEQAWKQVIMVALSFRQANETEAMQAWFDRAIGLASHPNDPRLSSLALRDVVKGLLAAGELAQAEALTSRIPDQRLRQLALADVVRRLAFSKESEHAATLTARLTDNSARALALRGLAEAEARFGKLTDALAVIQSISSQGQRDQALAKVALVRGNSGDSSGAMRVLESIGDERLRDLTLMQLAALPPGKIQSSPEILLGLLRDPQLRDQSLLELVAQQVAQTRLPDAEQAAARIENNADYGSAMELLTSLHLQLGDVRGALKRARGISQTSSRSRALELVAVEQVVRQGPKAARLTAELISEPRGRNRALRRIAERSATLGLGREIAYTIGGINDPVERALAYAAVAKTTARRGQVGSARLFLQDASREIADLSDSGRTARALSLLATAHAETGDEGIAFEVAAGISNVGLRDRTYQQLSRVFAADYEIDLAEEFAFAIEKETTRERALDDLAKVMAGRTCATEALHKVRQFDNRRQQVKFLLEVARRI